MKKVLRVIASTMFCATILTGAYAQQSETPPTPPTGTPFPQDKALTDPTMSRRLSADLNYRYEELGKNPVNWYDNKNGYYASYSIGSDAFITMYDRDGRYVETLKRGDWSDASVAPELKSSFEKSPYKSNEVSSYWSVTDQNRKGTYLELKNKQGKMSRVWADEKGKISATPPQSPDLTSSRK